LVVGEIHLNLTKYKRQNVIKWDVIGYYSYLPATFIDKDLALKFITPYSITQNSGIRYDYVDDSKGNHILKYSMGMSILYSPFFLTAHLLAKSLGYDADGFSVIYQFFVEFSGLFYLVVGLWYLRKLLLLYYSEKITATALLLIFFGTNLLYYASVESAMSHAYTFSLFSVFLYFTVVFYKNPTFKKMIVLALTFGLMVLVRPLNLLFVIPFLLYGIASLKDFKNRVFFLFQQYKLLLVFLIVLCLLILPQLMYYKYVTGNYIVFSYGSKEKFYFNNFHLFDVLFSFRKGWLIYTPMMIFSLYGIWLMRKHFSNTFGFVLLVFIPLYIYIISSWWCWWYGGSFSQRSLIDLYPLLSLPLAHVLNEIQNSIKIKKMVAYAFLSFFLFLNLFQTLQYKYNFIDYDAMTFKEYVKVFGSLKASSVDTSLLKRPNYERAVLGLPE
jgi:hypothetical protein